MNAYTPERPERDVCPNDPETCSCWWPVHRPVRVEEPAVEPRPKWHEGLTDEDLAVIREDEDENTSRVAQSANAELEG